SDHQSCATTQHCSAAFAPNHFLGTCLTDEWVKSMEAQLGVSATERDGGVGHLVNPYLRRALKFPRYQVEDERTRDPNAYGQCVSDMQLGSVVYGVNSSAAANASDNSYSMGVVNNSLVLELSGWNSQSLTTTVFAIIASEVYGYPVSMLMATDTTSMTQRMSSVQSGRCTPSHLTLEVWIAGIEETLAVYSNESYKAGALGYSGRSGLYTSIDLIKNGTNKKGPFKTTFYADFWEDYTTNDELISAFPVSSIINNSAYFPPTEVVCKDGSYGCLNNCSKSDACTKREKSGKQCLVVAMMYDYFDPGYLQATLSNIGFPAYFCFLGYTSASAFALDMQAQRKPVLFYHYEPDLFHFLNPGLFERVFLPRATPERVVLATGSYGENGYGNATTNPINVDFPTSTLQKYAASLLQNNQPVGQLVSRFSLSDLQLNSLLNLYLQFTNDVDPYFSAACRWVRDNYEVWKLWLDRMPVCKLDTHVVHTIKGCDNGSDYRTISFAWVQPDPENPSMPYNCDGGVSQLPQPLNTSRSCEWLLEDPRRWSTWTSSKPECDASFYSYSVSSCESDATRSVKFFWLLPNHSDPSRSLECQDGAHLPPNVKIDCEYMPFSSSGFVVVVIFAIILTVTFATAMVLVYWHRMAPIIKRSQFELLELMIVGGIIMCAAAIVYAGKPTYALCGARPVLISVGFTTIFCALVVKSFRVYRVFMRSAMKRVTVTTTMMLKVFVVLAIVDILIIGSWFAADFPVPHIDVVSATEFDGTVERISCKSSSFIFTALLMFWKTIVLFMGLYLSFLIRKVSADFQESIWIFGSALVVLFASTLAIPVSYIPMSAQSHYLIFAFILLFCTSLIMGLMLIPKFLRLGAVARQSDYSTSGTGSDKNRTRSIAVKRSAQSARQDGDSESTNVTNYATNQIVVHTVQSNGRGSKRSSITLVRPLNEESTNTAD
ncbi:TPA: hypothetical protein N0F65_000012, partial [Lagenidium giganteum]